MSDEKEKTYKISDRRKFNPDGTPRDPAAESEIKTIPDAQPIEAAEAEPAKVLSFSEGVSRKEAQEAKQTVEETEAAAPSSSAPHTPSELFISLLNMLAVEAAMYMGLIESPTGEAIEIDLEAARRMIDLLGVLQQKTHGNLALQEEAMLEGILTELRMQYVALSKPQ